MLAGILIALGLAIAAQGFGKATTLTGAISWRGAAFILPAPILFGLLINGLGMAPTVLITSLIAAFASRRMTLHAAIARRRRASPRLWRPGHAREPLIRKSGY